MRMAAVGLVVMTVLTALTSTAGAATTTQWNVAGNGGFVSLSVLNVLQLAGGGSEADASSSGPLAEAEGTGLCPDVSVTTNPCPTSATSPVGGNLLGSTQDAIAKGSGVTATPTGGGCTLPLNTGILDVDVSCGTASASTDSSGNPSATGAGSLASVKVSLSLASLLGLGSSAGTLCSGATAATTAGGAGAGGLTGTLGTLLGTVNSVLGGLSLPGLNGSTVDTSSNTTGACSLLGGLLNSLSGSGGAGTGIGILTGVLNQVLGLVGGNAVAIAPLSVTVGGSSTSVTTSGNVVTDAVTQSPVDINIFGLADLQVTPTRASVALDRSTGIVTPSCNAGIVSFSTSGGVQQFLQLGTVTQLVNNLLAQLSTTLNGLTSFLSSLIGDLLQYNPKGNLLNCSVSSPGPTANATVSIANAGLLSGLMGGITLAVGDVSASGSATTATPAVTTSAATAPAPPSIAPAAAATAVPNVTTVHTGEFWSGSLPVILLTGMGLAGVMLIGRRRILSAARSMNSIARRRGGQ
jgi:hypothetical protein